MRLAETRVAAALEAACRAELRALKPGNVGDHGGGHAMTVAQFEASAAAAAIPLADARLGVGERILAAVTATRSAVGCNTNLGIVLLAAPLAAAAQTGQGPLRVRLRTVLSGLDRADTEHVFRAIRLAAPGGLGRSAAHDVAGPACAGLVEVMASAAWHDRIAWQYAHGYADILELGLPALAWAARRWDDKRWATVYCYLSFLARFRDTHVWRKLGRSIAEEVRRTGARLCDRLTVSVDPTDLTAELLRVDHAFKAAGINPGTSADLTVATLFAERLQSLLD